MGPRSIIYNLPAESCTIHLCSGLINCQCGNCKIVPVLPPFHWATICSRPSRPLPIWGLTLERQQSAIIGEIVSFLHSDYAVVTLDTLQIGLRYDLFTIDLRRNCRFRYVLHTLIHDPKPIATDLLTIYLRSRRSWYDVGRPGYVHADQLTLWVRSNRRYLSWSYDYRRRSLPIPSSCPSIPWIQYTVPCIWFIFLISLSFSGNRLSWHYYSDGGASLAELIALSSKQI